MATRSMPERDAAFERRCPPRQAVPASAATAWVARTRSMRMPPTSVDLRTSKPATGIPKPCVRRRAGPEAGRSGCPRAITMRQRLLGARSSDPADAPADRASVMPGEANTSSSRRSAIAGRPRATVTWGRSSNPSERLRPRVGLPAVGKQRPQTRKIHCLDAVAYSCAATRITKPRVDRRGPRSGEFQIVRSCARFRHRLRPSFGLGRHARVLLPVGGRLRRLPLRQRCGPCRSRRCIHFACFSVAR